MSSHAAAVLSAFGAAANITALAKARHLLLTPSPQLSYLQSHCSNKFCDATVGKEGAQFYVVQGENSGLLLELACKSSEAGDCPGPGLMGGLVQLLRTSRDTHQHAESLSRVVSSFQSFCMAPAPDTPAGIPSIHADLKSAAVLSMTCRDGQVP